MKKTKKLLATIISAVLLIVSMLSTVFAANYDTTPIFDSPQNTAGTWWSGYDNDMFYGVNCSSSDVYGGDVGMRFIQSSVGLPASFYRMKNRVVYFELKEEDPGYDENELVREYVGIMGTGSTGLYQILGTRNTYTNSNCIEGNSIVELYIRMKVQVHNKDAGRTVTKGLIRCQFWAN